ncbi:MAG: NUDIX hydrolase [Gallionellaceae bacterium]|nr:NUDIX hydrolase [Gallionellaceae bacterium]
MAEHKKAGDEDLPIEVVNRRIVCENTKFLVYFDHVIDQAGGEVRDYLVVAPKNPGENLVTGVAILPIVDGQIGLIRIYRPAIRSYSWEIPHGFVEEGESDHSSASRELLEETGLTVAAECLSSLGYITPDSGVLAARVHLFLAEACYPSQQAQPEIGLREFRFFPVAVVEEMITHSDIQDTFTLAAWCKYQLLQNTQQIR